MEIAKFIVYYSMFISSLYLFCFVWVANFLYNEKKKESDILRSLFEIEIDCAQKYRDEVIELLECIKSLNK